MCGFQLGKKERTKQITLIKDIYDGTDLENKLAQSKIVILPLNDFPSDLLLVEEHDVFSSQASQSFTEFSIHTCQKDNNSDHLEFLKEQISLNNLSTLSPNTTICSSRSTTMQFWTIENYDFEDTDEEEEEDQLGIYMIKIIYHLIM